jgi:GNAT superfamily N-acetyltransferase
MSAAKPYTPGTNGTRRARATTSTTLPGNAITLATNAATAPPDPAPVATNPSPLPRPDGSPTPPARLVIRPAGPTDLTPLAFFCDTALRRDYFVRRGQLAEMLSGKHHRVLVAELDDVLVGVVVQTAGTRLVNVLIHPAYRGLGVGAALVRASGATEVRCKRDMSTGDPRGFYRALGFAPTGQQNERGNIELMRRPAPALVATDRPTTATTTEAGNANQNPSREGISV